LRQMQQATPLLATTSMERRRDEIFKMLSGPRPATPIRAMQMLGILPFALPELAGLKDAPQSPPHIFGMWEHTLAVVNKLDQLLNLLSEEYDPDKISFLMIGLAVLQLGRYRKQIFTHLRTPLNPDRPMRALLHLAALYHDVAKPVTSHVDDQGHIRTFGHDQIGARTVIERARALLLSNDEVNRLGIIVRHHMRIHHLAQGGESPSRKAIYRFFKDTGEAGIDICLLSLADTLATYGPSLQVEVWNSELEVCRLLFESWWEKSEEVVRPSPLVNGNDLMNAFALKQGPILGELLEVIREAQAIGLVRTREEAIALAQQRLEERER
jgi:poly(A) polymerase